MQTISVTRKRYQKLVRCYEEHVWEWDRRRAEWDAIFSCNQFKEAWPVHDYGYSHADDREYLHTRYRLLREIVEVVLANDPCGGRFFLNEDGVFVKSEEGDLSQIASFNW